MKTVNHFNHFIMKQLPTTPIPHQKYCITFIFFMAFNWSFGQTPMTIKHACNFAADATEGSVFTYDASTEAINIVKEISEACGLPQNFIIKSADCSNALATTQGKQRYILYNTSFLEAFKTKAETKWAAYCVLAHEIGHHLSNHDLEITDPSVRRRQELESDRFAGDVLQKLGASLVQAQSGINTFALDGDSQTHPSKRARLEALATGWKKAQERKNISDGDDADINADEVKLYKKAVEMAKTDFTKAVEVLTKAIETNPRYSEAFIRRAEYYLKTFEFDDALEDLDEAIRINKNAYEAYALNGFILAYEKENKEKGLNDINRAIRINKEFVPAYLYKAFVTVQNQNVKEVFQSAKADLDVALKLDPKYCEAYYFRGCIHHFNEQYDKAVEDLTKAIELKPLSKIFVLKHYYNKSDEYEELTAADMLDFRALTHYNWGKWTQAIADYDKEEVLKGMTTKPFMIYAKCLYNGGKTREALAYLDNWAKQIIERRGKASGSHTLFDIYKQRGIFKMLLGNEAEGLKDFQSAFGLDNYSDDVYGEFGCRLVENKLAKAAMPYLDKVLESGSSKFKKCREEALKLLKKN